MRSESIDWAAHIEAVARRLRGEPNKVLSSTTELRFGSKGGLKVTIAGEHRGTWTDFTEPGAGGGVLDLICHERDCSKGAALEWFQTEMKVQMSEEAKPNAAPHHSKGRKRWVATFNYYYEEGDPAYRVHRYEFENGEKIFPQERANGKGGWIGGKGCMDGVRRVPYRLPELLAASDRVVFITEGEKHVDALLGMGLLATSGPEGARKWKPEFAQYFHGRTVIILPDNDDPGRDHASDIVRNLLPVVASIRVVDLPGLPEKGDIIDWLDAGGDRDTLLALVEAAQPVREMPAAAKVIQFRQNQAKDHPEEEDDEPSGDAVYVQNDIGNALMLVEQHGRDLRYVLGNGWYIWDGKRYAVDPEGVATQRRAHEIPAALIEEARKEPDKKRRLKKLKWAVSCGNGSRISGMLTQAKSYLFKNVDELDHDPLLLNCQNGTVDLRTGLMGPHLRDDLLSKICGTDYDPRADCPRWKQFLLEIFNNDTELVLFVQRAIGYSVTGMTKEHVVFIMHGAGSNGKSVLLETIAAVLGEYHDTSASETWVSKPTGAPSNDIAGLAGARFVSVIETEHDKQLAEALVKQATGGDRMKVRFMYREFFEFMPTFKLWFATNHKPKIRGSDFAIWRRIILLPFIVTFTDVDKVTEGQKAKDPDLKDKLVDEYPGILAWIIQGALAWQAEGLKPPDAVIAATEGYQDSQDNVSAFIRDNCWLGHGMSCAAGFLYAGYQNWCQENDEEPISAKALARNLDERGLPPVHRTKAARMRKGIDLKEEVKKSAAERQSDATSAG